MNEQREINPYAPPKTRPEPETPPGVWRTEPRRVPAINGLLWWWRAARVVAARPGLWAAALGLATAVPTVLTVIGVDFDGDDDEEEIFFSLGFLLWLFWPVLTGGIVNAAHKQLRGERIRLRDIFAFFRSLVLSLGWIFVDFIVITPLMFFVFALLLVALEALPLTSAAAPVLACALAAILVTGNMFIAAVAALHDEWPSRMDAFFRAGLVNMPAFLLNLPVASLAFLAMRRVEWCIEPLSAGWPYYLMPLLMALNLALFFSALSLVAYAAVRDIFYNEE